MTYRADFGLGKGAAGTVAVMVAVAVALGGCSSSSKSTVSSGTTASGGTSAATAAATTAKNSSGGTYKVGDTAKTSNFQVTVYGFKDPYAPSESAFNAPAGQHFVTVDVQVTNLDSSKAQSFSSLAGFHLLDSANHQYDETIVPGLSPTAPEGEIPAGGSVRGFVAFQAPDGTTGLRFRVQGSLTAAGAIFSLS